MAVASGELASATSGSLALRPMQAKSERASERIEFYLLVRELGVNAMSWAKNWPYCMTKWV